MSAMCVTPSSVDSSGCGLEVSGSRALSCAKYIHLKCSRFPALQLVRFEVTRASYICEFCDTEEIGRATIVGELWIHAGRVGDCAGSSGDGIPVAGSCSACG